MTVNIICDKDAILGIIGFETDDITGLIRSGSEPGTIRVDSVVKHEKLKELRDKLNRMFPIGEKTEDVPEWRREGEWTEVALEEAREGDYAEYDCIIGTGDVHTVGKILKSGDQLVVTRSSFIEGHEPRGVWAVIRRGGKLGPKTKNVRIWRRLDMHRFDEPKGEGYYATQSGGLLYNDGDSYGNWYAKANAHVMFSYKSWGYVLENLGESEFPLVRLTPETLRKAVAE